MAMQAPRQLSTWLEGIKTRYTPGISVPRLWGRDEEYGIDYPLDITPQEGTSGPDEAAAILEADVRGGTFRAPTILRGPGGEEESFNVPPPPPEPPSRAEVSKMFDEHFGNPDMFDPMAETAKRMEDLDADIRKKLDIRPGPEGLKVASPYVKKMYTTMLADEQKALYKAMVDKGKRIKAYKTEVLTNFDKQMAAAQQARAEKRAEEYLGIAKAKEARAAKVVKGKPQTETQRIAPIIKKMNALTKRYGQSIDFMALMLMPEASRMEYLKGQTGDIVKKLPKAAQAKYFELEKQLYGESFAPIETAKPLTVEIAKSLAAEIISEDPTITKKELSKRVAKRARERGYTIPK